MSQPLILVESLRPGIASITLNRPEKRNALSRDLMRELCAALAQLASPGEAARVLLLRGAGPVFCAGLDLTEAADTERAEESARLVAETLRAVYESPLVTIAVATGPAVAGGAGIVTACDLAVAERGVELAYPEVRHGLVAALVSGLLCAQVPRRVARELLLLGQSVDAERAAAWGLINRAAPRGRGLAVALEMADAILSGGPEAVVRTKKLVNDFSGAAFQEELRQAFDTHLAARFSEEAREGLAAFREKRAPRWQKEASR